MTVMSGALLAGCGTSPESVRVTVNPASSLRDDPVTFSVAGLSPGQRVTLSLASSDSKGVRWTSDATFVASAQGRIQTSESAPIAGSYEGVDAAGLLDSMSPPAASSDTEYFWGPSDQSFLLTVDSGDTKLVSTTL